MSANNLTREEAARRAALFSNLSYRISLDVTGDEERFGCDATITFDCAEPGAETFLDFICNQVSSIELNGYALDPSAADGNRLRVPGVAATNTLRIVSRPLYEHTGVGLHRFVDPVDGQVYLHTQFESFDAHKVFPCVDQPDLKATFEFEVRAPREFEVASNMAGTAREDGDARVWTFAKTPLMSTYITAVVAGPFHIVRDRHGSIDLGLWCRRSLAEYLDPEEFFEITKQGFDFFESTFAVPYPFGKYDQLFVPEFNAGAMENAGCVTFNESYIFRSKVTESRRERRAATILHEMAHMWFGDLVTMKWWDDLWLNESFAEYVALVAQVRSTRFRNGFVTFSDSEKTWA
ncbi:MAG: M1 family metallopeptidase, partial [Vicinamibacterales bacterium]